LIIEREVSVWDALLGANIEIQTLDRKTLSMSLPPGTQPDTVMSCKGEGLPNMRTKQRGNLLIRIKVIVPKVINPEQIKLIQQIKIPVYPILHFRITIYGTYLHMANRNFLVHS
jgi:DnaJ-class molecular chaperone